MTHKDPSNFIQWKGTDVCMDVHCMCGYHSHLDCSFAYYIRCPKCKRVYQMGNEVSMTLVDTVEARESAKEGFGEL